MIRIENHNGEFIWINRQNIDTVMEAVHRNQTCTRISIGERHILAKDSVPSIMKRIAYDDWCAVNVEDLRRKEEADYKAFQATEGKENV